MPTVFAHAVAGAALGSAVRPTGKAAALAAVCAVLPDLDVLAFAAGIPYEHALGHRGLSHSLAAAALVGALVVGLFFQRAPNRLGLWALFTAASTSHGLLDMLTDGGLGVGLLLPFRDARLFFPVRPVEVSPIGAGFFSARGLAVLQSEAVWIGLPSVLVASGAWLARHRARRAA